MKLSPVIYNIALMNLAFSSSLLFAAEAASDSDQSKFYIESLNYKEEAFSTSERQGAGQNADIEVVSKYKYSDSTYARFRLKILGETPEYDPKKTSQLEAGIFHKEGRISGFAEFRVNANDNGGISVGLDDDSYLTMLRFDVHSELNFQYNPFNLGTKIGDEFQTSEVSEVHYIDTPMTVITNLPVNGEEVVSKTAPGVMVNWNPEKYISASLGFAVASYLYPAGEDATIYEGLVSDRWQKNQDNTVLFRASYDNKDNFGIYVEHASHDSADKAGSLIKAATSIRGYLKESFIKLSAEFTGTKAGQNPYKLDGKWFANNQATLFNPSYIDIYEQKQDWVGQQGSAYMVKVEYVTQNILPFIAYKNYSEHFVYNHKNSAHYLRTADLTKSHGGLTTYSIGSAFKYKGYEFIPEIEHEIAKNEVFLNSGEIRSDRKLNGFKKDNTILKMAINYNIQ